MDQPGVYHMDRIAQLVLGCRNAVASDGLVYNVCVLAIERAIHSRRFLVQTIAVQLRDCRPGADLDLIKTALACHVEVLMRSGGVVQSDE